jgi:Ca-activated chloride channel family protein
MKGDKLQTAKDSAIAFTEALGKDDKLAIISFNDAIKVLEGFTTDFSRIKEAIMEVEASGGTALYDAIYRASDMMKNIDARKVIVLLSDGRDESTSGLTPGSLHTFEESIDKALRNEVIVFSIGVGKNLDREMDFYNRKNLKEILEELASDTGGIFYSAERTSQVKKAYSMIAEELKHQYSMAFPPGATVRDGSWRTITVKTKYPDYRVIARKGYFAPKE